MRKKIINWLLLLMVAGAALAMVAIPVWLIQPFAPQTERALEVSYYLRSWSPVLTVVLAIAALLICVQIWRNSKRWFTNLPLLLPLLVIGFSVWFAQQNHFLWMFNPLKNSAYAKISEVDFVKDDEMVMSVEINNEAVAYPVLQMAYHHLVQDVVGGKPITATY